MPGFDSGKMDTAANDALIELESIMEEHPDGVKAVQDWVKKWFPLAGYKRLGKILAERWESTET